MKKILFSMITFVCIIYTHAQSFNIDENLKTKIYYGLYWSINRITIDENLDTIRERVNKENIIIDVGDYFVDSLYYDNKFYHNGEKSKSYLLFHNESSIYECRDNEIISFIRTTVENNEALEYLKSKNIKIIERSDPRYPSLIEQVVETKNSYIKFSNFATEFKKDESYSVKVDKFWNDYETLQNQIISYKQSLKKYYDIWAIKGSRMSSADINSWKAVTNKVIPILSKFSKLTDDNFTIYNGTESKKKLVGKGSDAVDMIFYSRNVLGM